MRFLFLIIGIVVYLALSWEHAYTRSVSLYSGKVLTLANLTTEAVNGHHHALTIRTAMSQADVASHQAPVLLILHGGPAWSDIPFLYGSDYLLEEHFIVVHYDQRSAGKSCRYYGNSSNNNFASHNNLTIQQHVDDAVAIVQYLQKKFHQEKVYLMGGSWGSVLSLLAAKQQPDLFHFVAVHGTLVNGLSNELISREYILHQFPTANIPMPPYKSVDELVLQRQWLNRAGGVFYKDPLPAAATRYIPQLRFRSQVLYYAVHLLLAPEFSWGDKLRFGRCYRETSAQLMEELLVKYDAYRAIEGKLEVPILFLHGRYDRMVVLDLVDGFFNSIQAPWKRLVWMEESGHFPDREEPALFQRIILDTFLQQDRVKEGASKVNRDNFEEKTCSWDEAKRLAYRLIE